MEIGKIKIEKDMYGWVGKLCDERGLRFATHNTSLISVIKKLIKNRHRVKSPLRKAKLLMGVGNKLKQ